MARICRTSQERTLSRCVQIDDISAIILVFVKKGKQVTLIPCRQIIVHRLGKDVLLRDSDEFEKKIFFSQG
jgi:hypothetical protein